MPDAEFSMLRGKIVGHRSAKTIFRNKIDRRDLRLRGLLYKAASGFIFMGLTEGQSVRRLGQPQRRAAPASHLPRRATTL
jgi:ribosomal protein L15E